MLSAAPISSTSPAAPTAPKPPAPVGTVADFDPQQLAALNAQCAALDTMDYFEILKITPSATSVEIKAAFYRESRANHPDRFFHLSDKDSKQRVGEVYKRITEAYYVLRDDLKRARYAAEVSGPERAQKLRFTEASEVEAKQAVKKEAEEQIGMHPKGREFFKTAMREFEAERWSAAERNFKMAVTYEPQNARYKEMLGKAQQKVYEESKKSGDPFRIK